MNFPLLLLDLANDEAISQSVTSANLCLIRFSFAAMIKGVKGVYLQARAGDA